MDLLVIMVLLALVVVFVSAPLRRAPDPAGQLGPDLAAQASEPEVRELESARDAKLRELRDAELDYRTGKLSEADYQALDGTLRAEAIEILRALDTAREQSSDRDGQDRPSPDTISG
jgi:hypothetical protein